MTREETFDQLGQVLGRMQDQIQSCQTVIHISLDYYAIAICFVLLVLAYVRCNR